MMERECYKYTILANRNVKKQHHKDNNKRKSDTALSFYSLQSWSFMTNQHLTRSKP